MSPERESKRHPAWAERERASDLAWIRENLYVLWPAAQMGYKTLGRGAILIDIQTVVVHEGGEGNPMLYVSEEQIASRKDDDALGMVQRYDPTWELVTILIKSQNRESIYRVGVPDLKSKQ